MASPVTVEELLREGTDALPTRDGIPDPRREARWLLARACGVDESWLVVHPTDGVPGEAAARFRHWIERRAAGEPAHHLAGRCTFWGRSFEVSAAVLVPRPETELLVEVTLDLPMGGTARVLDVGTGSGCIAITLAAERPGWMLAGVDRSLGALQLARRNVRVHDVTVALWLGDLTQAAGGPVDLVVANLPYVPSPALSGLPVEVRHDPTVALDGGPDGLDLIRSLLADVTRVLRPCGGVVLELGEGQADDVAEIAAACGLAVARRARDLAGVDRIVVLQRR